MAYASRMGRARVNARSPSAAAVCDRCGIWVNHVTLRAQAEWFGTILRTFNILVCDRCYDTPQENIRAIVIPADPIPIQNPRIEYFASAEEDNLVTSGQNTVDPVTGLPVIGGNNLVTQGNDQLTPQATGVASGSANTTPGVGLIAVPDDIGENDPGLPLGYTDVPKTGPLNGQ